MARRNPPWTRDELILALDLYFRVSPHHTSKENPEIKALSHTLNRLNIHTDIPNSKHFRNPNGVYMKLCNFLRVDPSYKGKGLEAGSKLDIEVWEEFASDRERLHRTAEGILATLDLAERSPAQFAGMNLENEEFPEGRLLTRLHRARERSPAIVKRKKEKTLTEMGRLQCEVCGFDFHETYGELGKGFAECHHTVPLADLAEHTRTKLIDLAIVCANCHRMIHRSSPMISVQELRKNLDNLGP